MKSQPAMSPSDMDVSELLDALDAARRAEAEELLTLCEQLTGATPQVWARRIIGFGVYEYRYESGHGGRAPELAFASGPRQHTIYLVNNFAERWPELMNELGRHRASKACLYLTRLTGVNRAALRTLLERSLEITRQDSK